MSRVQRARPPRVPAAAAAVLLALAACSDDGGGGEAADADGDAASTEPAETRTPAMPAVEGPVTGSGAAYLDPLELAFPPDDSAEAAGTSSRTTSCRAARRAIPIGCGSR